MVKITKKLAHKSNYGYARNTSIIKYIVIHYTGNDGDNGANNAKYFQSPNREASAHYFVDDNSITQSVSDNYVAWSVGGGLMDYGSSYYSKGGKYYGKCTNINSISIEMCDTKKDGKNNVSAKTRKNTIDLVVYLSKKYNIPRKNVIRHFDVNHKLCPIYYVTNEDAWNKFLDDSFGKLTNETKSTKPPIANPILRVGSKGTQVKYLQRDLNYLFKDDISVDGDFGNKTKETLKKFQKKYKLTQDGIYGLDSRTKMAEVIKEK